ncbi:MAG: methylglyoxal synthase [Peptostreptococcaceae bacterium]|jgi:methylglyoxal synthase|nr:methylglyoxal synthase [Peptostreptococcaceae bacterium]
MNISLIAHDEKKDLLVNFCVAYEYILEHHTLFATGTTGLRIMDQTKLNIHRFKSGPYGGDQQIGAKIAEDNMDLVIFLRDPMAAQPHEPDIQALIRLCDVHHVPIATNLASAELFIKAIERGDLDWRAIFKK